MAELQIQVAERLHDDAYHSQVVNDKNALFTRMEVQDPIFLNLSSAPIGSGTSL